MKIRAEMGRQRAPLCPPEYQVDKVVELPNTQFAAFLMRPLDRYDFIGSNQVEPHQGTGHDHCLLVLGEGREDGVLVQCGGDGRAAYSAYMAGVRDIVRAQLDRAVGYIVRQATENTSNGSWCVYYDELERELGLTIRDGSGLDTMLVDAMRSRPEVADVVLIDGCVDAVYYLDFCKCVDAEEEAPTPFTMERKAQLFENAVSAVCDIFDYEDLYTMLHGSFGLTLQEIRAHNYMSDQEIAQTCGIPEELLNCDMTVRDVLRLEGVSESASLTHKDSTVLVPLEDLEKLTASGQEDFAALLDARVADIRVDDGEPELVLEGVEAAELERFCDALEAHEQAEQAMGDMTP